MSASMRSFARSPPKIAGSYCSKNWRKVKPEAKSPNLDFWSSLRHAYRFSQAILLHRPDAGEFSDDFSQISLDGDQYGDRP